MQRYFAKAKIADSFILHDSDMHHIKNVMRGKINDQIEVVYDGIIYIMRIRLLEPFTLEMIDKIREDKEMNVNLTVAVSLVNEQKMDLILQKLTELGVSTIIPIKTERSIIKLDDKKLVKKLTRWQMICKEASEQSKRTTIPKIAEVMNLQELPNASNGLKLLCSLNDNTKPLQYYLKKNIKEILFAIGPEGGFTDKEEKYLLNNDFRLVSLGKRVMRVETATIYVASIVNFICEG